MPCNNATTIVILENEVRYRVDERPSHVRNSSYLSITYLDTAFLILVTIPRQTSRK